MSNDDEQPPMEDHDALREYYTMDQLRNLTGKEPFFSSDEYLKPAVEDDALLHLFDDDRLSQLAMMSAELPCLIIIFILNAIMHMHIYSYF